MEEEKLRKLRLKIKRSFEEAHEGKDTIYPMEDFSGNIGEERRRKCLLEVLMRIPEKDFKELKKKKDSFHWYIPGTPRLGEIYPFSITQGEEKRKDFILVEKATILYLSPLLEFEDSMDEKVVIAVIAHELAHLVLNHKMFVSHEKDIAQEKGAWNLIRKWGFEEEERAHREFESEES